MTPMPILRVLTTIAMLKKNQRLAAVIVAFALLVGLPPHTSAQNTPAGRPIAKNVVFIMLDDADFSDFGFNSHLQQFPDAITPNMNAIRENGMLLSNFYAASSVCSPTRVSVLTGRNPMAFGAAYAWATTRQVNAAQGLPGTSGLPTSVPQLGHLMRGAGKVTGHFGKWHVGRSREEFRHAALGFDHWGALVKGPSPFVWDGAFQVERDGVLLDIETPFLDRVFGEMVRGFIADHADVPQGFFVNYWPYSPHFPLTAPADFDNSTTNFDLSSDRGRLLAMMHDVDAEIGRIVETLENEGILDTTLLVLTSDNGGLQRARHGQPYLHGNKNSLFEGGIRVSAVAQWPGVIRSGSTNPTVMTTADLLPTFLDAVGHDGLAEVLPNVEGRSKLLALVSGEEVPAPPIYWEVETGSYGGPNEVNSRAYAMRSGKYKILKHAWKNRPKNRSEYMVFDLEADPTEKTDLSTTEPELTKDLAAQLQELRMGKTRLDVVPETVSQSAMVLPADPRLDISRKDVTFCFTIDLPDGPVENLPFIQKTGSYSVWLDEKRRLHWQVRVANVENKPVMQTLVSKPLSPGKNKIVLSARGFKRSTSQLRLYVNGSLHSDADWQSVQPEIAGIWSELGPLTIGNDSLHLSDISYNMTWLTPDEIPALPSELD